ncbi:MAG TPA: glutamine-hydrolyzing carbamoyl-phosphate synthase small subunit [Thermoanaerobaculia bacterium]|nr:glutamine-hydrolyzing carbamoyl-phosphate synthase small subunit [Thermoanaerobaculia bacterium]
MLPARLILEDGVLFEGHSFGASDDAIGEVVFNTSLTGYQEIATDPSYRFQIVTMTYPHIGNYGIDRRVDQSDAPQVAGLVVRELFEHPTHARSQMSLSDYFTLHAIPGITGVDTRALTRKIRSEGAMRGMLTTSGIATGDAVATIREAPSMTGLDLVQKVTALRPHLLHAEGEAHVRIAVYDFGVKRDILRHLTGRGCEVVVYPATTHPNDILEGGFDAVVLSNGPGDPEPVVYAQASIRKLIGRLPIFGICLGHQLLGLALGGRTYKLKFGHRGGNHPVKDLQSGRVEITSQNHGFSVDPDSLNESEVELTHINLNDGTLEGFRHRNHPILAVQYHPEAAPGPHDSFYLFDEFLAMIDQFRGRSVS